MTDKKNGSEVKQAQSTMTKKEAVERSLRDLGNTATPTQLKKHIWDRYRIEMDLKHISTAKAKILNPASHSKPAVAKPAAVKPTTPASASPKPVADKAVVGKVAVLPGGSQGINLRDIETVKDLVERVGAASLRKLIDVMAR